MKKKPKSSQAQPTPVTALTDGDEPVLRELNLAKSLREYTIHYRYRFTIQIFVSTNYQLKEIKLERFFQAVFNNDFFALYIVYLTISPSGI